MKRSASHRPTSRSFKTNEAFLSMKRLLTLVVIMHISPIYIQKQDHSCIFLHLFMQYFFYLNESDRPSFKDNLKNRTESPTYTFLNRTLIWLFYKSVSFRSYSQQSACRQLCIVSIICFLSFWLKTKEILWPESFFQESIDCKTILIYVLKSPAGNFEISSWTITISTVSIQ